MTSINDVRLIVDKRIAALEEKRAKRLEARRLRCCSEHRELIAGDFISSSCDDIDLDEVKKHMRMGSGAACFRYSRNVHLPDDLCVPPVESRPPNLRAANLSFAARLILAIQDKFGGDAPKVYTAAKVSRQVYSQIITDETRAVSKRTAIRFAFALKMTPGEAKLLLKSAGYAFSNSQTEDFILQACLEVDPPIWDLDVVNQLLKEYRVDFQY